MLRDPLYQITGGFCNSTHPQVLLSPWKSQGFKEEIVTTIGWYDLLTSTTLESKKSHQVMKEGIEP
jgi:hypothetical protein